MKTVRLTDIAFDAGTQIRAAINEDVVANYAERMTEGDQFPPVVLFHDGNHYYLGDGFHRCMAARRIDLQEIDAEVRAGTKSDALWFALGANRTNGQRLGDRDVRNAVQMAIRTWPDRSGKQIAEQLGCSQSRVSAIRDRMRLTASPTDTLPDRVIGKDGKSYPASLPKEKPPVDPRRKSVVDMVRDGKSSKDICAEIGVRSEMVADVRRELGVAKPDNSRDAIRERRERIPQMAAQGFSSRQIASAIGVSENRTRMLARKLGVEIIADKTTRGTHRHDSNRIVERIVLDAENLTEGINLIDFSDLDRDRIAEWLRSLSQSRDNLGGFIRRLMKEQKDGKAA